MPRRLPAERRVLTDARTGVTIWQMTDQPARHSPLAAIHPSVTPNGRLLLFVSDRCGAPNLFTVSLEDGVIAQITDVEDLNPGSPALGRDSARVFYTAGEEIRTVYLASGEEEVLAGFPGARLGNVTVSADGGWVATCVMREERHALVAVHTGGATGSGATTVLESSQPIGTAQFAPSTDNALLYSGGARERVRLVRFDGTEERCVAPQGPNDWFTQETWLGAERILFLRWPQAVMSIRRDGTDRRELASFYAWAPAARADGSLIVCDTLPPDEGLQLLDPATGERRLLCDPRALSAEGALRSPASPSFSPDGTRVIYASDATGHLQICVAHLLS
jgi:oligogalacturonide lyase